VAPDKPRSFIIALMVGLLALPAAAVALSLGRNPVEAADEAATPSSATSTAVVTSLVADGRGLEVACGRDGLRLFAAEADGSITALQQAALDALRPICAEEGTALPGASAGPATTLGGTQAAAPVSGAGAQIRHDTAAQESTTTSTVQESALGAYTVTGGSADIEFSRDAARVVSVHEAAGFTAVVNQSGPDAIDITFAAPAHVSTITVTRPAGEWAVGTAETPLTVGGGAAAGNNDDRDGDEGDDDRNETDDRDDGGGRGEDDD